MSRWLLGGVHHHRVEIGILEHLAVVGRAVRDREPRHALGARLIVDLSQSTDRGARIVGKVHHVRLGDHDSADDADLDLFAHLLPFVCAG